MKKTRNYLAHGFFISIVLALIFPSPVTATRGLPGSPEFGIGARLSPDSQNLDAALTLIAQLKPDWLSIELDWNALNPDPGVENWDRLGMILESVHNLGPAVMVSLTNPPKWARSEAGPDPNLTADFVEKTASRYQTYINAIELFPAPNTRAGWGASPNSANYLNLYRTVSGRLGSQESTIVLVSGGLEVNISNDESGDIKDIDFLQELYSIGANTVIPVIGLRFSGVNGLPSAHSSRRQDNVLRHYEDIRRLMTTNGHVSGILWITFLSFPSGTSTMDQTEWLAEAYSQIRTQLYIGAAFLQGINTCASASEDCSEVSLLEPNGSDHPFTPVLRGILARNMPPPDESRPGRAKTELFRKNR